jgi:hypothetical protein
MSRVAEGTGGILDERLEKAGGLYFDLNPFNESDQYIARLFTLQKQGCSTDAYKALSIEMAYILEKINGSGIHPSLYRRRKRPFF